MRSRHYPNNRFNQDSALDTYSVRLTAWHARMARELGDGCMGDGIRKAIEEKVRENELDIIHKDD